MTLLVTLLQSGSWFAGTVRLDATHLPGACTWAVPGNGNPHCTNAGTTANFNPPEESF